MLLPYPKLWTRLIRVRFIWEDGNAMQIEVGNFHDEDK